MPGRKTLIILSPGFPADENDSTCLPAQQEFVKSLVKNFPELQIIVLAFQYPFFTSSYEWNGVSVMSFGGRDRKRLARLFNWFKVSTTLSSLKKTENIIGVLSFWYGECALIGKRFARKHGLKHYCWLLGQDARKGNVYYKRAPLKGTELVAMSDFLADEFERNYSMRPAHTITNGVGESCNQHTSARNIDIIGVGSLIPLKQYGLFIDCIIQLKNIFPSLRAVICGKGPELEKLQQMINTSGLQSNITLAGERPHSEILSLLARSKILLHPSSYEGCSTVCLEALHSGSHVVSFCEPMHRKIDHWHIVKTRKEMLGVLEFLLKDPAIDHSAVTPFRMDDSAREMMKLFLQ